MKFQIHFKRNGKDQSVIIEGLTVQECIEKTVQAIAGPGTDPDTIRSERLPD